MATLFLDGFDKYGPTGEISPSVSTLMAQEWTSISTSGGSVSLVAGLSSTGFAFNVGANNGNPCGATKTLPSTYSRLIGGMRIQPTYAGTGCAFIQFRTSGGTAMCSVFGGGLQLLSIATGNLQSAAFATSNTRLVPSSTYYLEWDITFGASSSFQFWVNGVSVMSGTGNTGNGNTAAGQIFLGSDGAGLRAWGAISYDDLYVFDSTGLFNNAVLNTNPHIETRYPTGDSQTQFTNGGNLLVPSGTAITNSVASTASSFTAAAGANQLLLLRVKAAVTCTLNSVNTVPGTTSAGAKLKAVLYTDNSGSPNILTATGTEVVGTTSGVLLSAPFGAGQSLTAGTFYWIGFITDTSLAFGAVDATTNLGQKAANTYASGAPAPAPAMTSGQSTWQFWGNCTGATTNWASVAQNPAPGTGAAVDNGAITSITVNNEDLYSFPSLSTSTNVYVMGVKGNMKKDAGTRTMDLRLKSSATDSAGSTAGQTPGTTYGWLDSYFDSDPNGSIAWTGAAANAATAGPKVAT